MPAATGVLGAAALLVGLGLGPSPVAAADEPAVVLPGTAFTAITGDVDGDGTRELIRIVSASGFGGDLVEAWGYDAGGWRSLGSATMLRPAPAGDGTARLELNRDAAALLPWTVDGRERVLVLTAGHASGGQIGETCCLSIAEVRLDGGGLVLRPLEAPGSDASFVQAADVDADGTDELVLVSYSLRTPQGPQRLQLLRWNGLGFEIALEREDSEEFLNVWTGESDGIPGDEVLFGPTRAGSLERLAWIDGEPRSETTLLEVGRVFDGWAVGATGGVTVLALSDGVHVLRWPRGADATDARHETAAQFPSVFLLGSGAEALIVLFDGLSGPGAPASAAAIYDLGLRPLAEVAPGPAADQVFTGFGVDGPIFPYIGPVPNGWSDARPAMIANGMLILPDGSGSFEKRPIASFAGTQPIGLVGPGAEWLAMSDGFLFVSPQQAYLQVGGFAPMGRIMVEPLHGLLRADEDVAVASIVLHDAVATGEPLDGVQPMLAEGAGFEVIVEAASGSRVFVGDGWRSQQHEVGDVPLVVEVRAPRLNRADENQRLDVSLVVVTPEGRISSIQWEGTFVREPPELSVSGATETLAMRAHLDGRASPGATVTADSRAVATDADGRFAVAIDAPIWPSNVIVTARDPLGNETTDLVEVVGFYDYRDLPWPAFVVVATIVAGAVLFLRVPKARPQAVAWGLADDARLEEIELDPDPDRPAVAP